MVVFSSGPPGAGSVEILLTTNPVSTSVTCFSVLFLLKSSRRGSRFLETDAFIPGYLRFTGILFMIVSYDHFTSVLLGIELGKKNLPSTKIPGALERKDSLFNK